MVEYEILDLKGHSRKRTDDKRIDKKRQGTLIVTKIEHTFVGIRRPAERQLFIGIIYDTTKIDAPIVSQRPTNVEIVKRRGLMGILIRTREKDDYSEGLTRKQ
jgi:hypothetical protein